MQFPIKTCCTFSNIDRKNFIQRKMSNFMLEHEKKQKENDGFQSGT